MSELRKIICKSVLELPSIELIFQELNHNDRIRIDYNINSEIKDSRELAILIKNLKESPYIEVVKNGYNDLEFYNIFNLFKDKELIEISVLVEKACKEYRQICEKLINEFEKKYDHSFIDPEKSIFSIRHKLKADNNQLNKYWTYKFHGGDVCFTNLVTEQIVEINLKYYGHYGVLSLWFFQCFMESTIEFKEISRFFEENTPKLDQVLKFLKKKEHLKTIKSDIFPNEILIWNEKKVHNII